MSDFEIVRSFGIDNGELDGFSPQECFCLGYELALFDHLVNKKKSFEFPIARLANVPRMTEFAEKSGYDVQVYTGLLSEDYSQLSCFYPKSDLA